MERMPSSFDNWLTTQPEPEIYQENVDALIRCAELVENIESLMDDVVKTASESNYDTEGEAKLALAAIKNLRDQIDDVAGDWGIKL